MKTIGLVGGISWISTIDYYRMINQGINDRLGGLNFAQCLIYSFNYADIKRNNDANDWDATFRLVSRACSQLESCGAEGILLCANTIHHIADRLQGQLGVPLIHIATATVEEVLRYPVRRIGLLGTRFTMELDFIKSHFRENGIEVLIPDDGDRAFIHGTITDELGKGILRQETKNRYLEISGKLIAKGAQGIVLGCTEIPLVIQPGDLPVRVFDSTRLHAGAAVKFALGD